MYASYGDEDINLERHTKCMWVDQVMEFNRMLSMIYTKSREKTFSFVRASILVYYMHGI
jgi:hypothetical protein